MTQTVLEPYFHLCARIHRSISLNNAKPKFRCCIPLSNITKLIFARTIIPSCHPCGPERSTTKTISAEPAFCHSWYVEVVVIGCSLIHSAHTAHRTPFSHLCQIKYSVCLVIGSGALSTLPEPLPLLVFVNINGRRFYTDRMIALSLTFLTSNMIHFINQISGFACRFFNRFRRIVLSAISAPAASPWAANASSLPSTAWRWCPNLVCKKHAKLVKKANRSCWC